MSNLDSFAMTLWLQAAEHFNRGEDSTAKVKLNTATWQLALEAGIPKADADAARRAVLEAQGSGPDQGRVA